MVAFLTIMAIGFVILVMSLVLGEIFEHGGEIAHDIVVEHDLGMDHDGSIEHGQGGPSVFSVRFMAAFATGFGGAGAIGMHLGCSIFVSSFFGIIGAFLLAGIVYWIVKFLFKQQSSSTLTMVELVGQEATVTIPIPVGGTGQVMLDVKGATSTHMAVSETDQNVPLNTTVIIRKTVGDKVIVGIPTPQP